MPSDFDQRKVSRKTNVKLLLLPLSIIVFALLISIGIQFYLSSRMNLATSAYHNAEDYLINQEYELAFEELENAISLHAHFSSAIDLHHFSQIALSHEELMKQEDDHQLLLQKINQTKNELQAYTGEAVDLFQDKLVRDRTAIQLEIVKEKLNNTSNLKSLPPILWEVEGIQDPEAFEIASSIREQIVAHTSSEANKLAREKQFSKALELVENGLYYVPNSEKLASLSTSIANEKTAFETAQEERMEQAVSAYQAEQEINLNDAIELIDIEVSENSRGNIIVAGEIKSVATVPIHTIAISYHIENSTEEQIETNETYVYPTTLYPGETGKFDYTYFNLEESVQDLEVIIDTITWFLD